MISRRLFQRSLLAPMLARARPLRRGDDLTVWPTLVHRAANGRLQARIEAWVFEHERNPTRARLLARAFDIELDELADDDRQRFDEGLSVVCDLDETIKHTQCGNAGRCCSTLLLASSSTCPACRHGCGPRRAARLFTDPATLLLRRR